MEVRIATRLVPLVLSFCVLHPAIAAEGGYPAHEVAIVAGGAWNDSRNANFAGFEYEYRRHAQWGIGGVYETTWQGFDLEIVAGLASFYPSKEWRLFAGGGVERKLGTRKNKALARFGVGYVIPVGDFALTPMLYVDWVEDNSTVTYLGLSVGFHL